jgi:nucleoside-diphosphate-sugar epimerase
MKKVLVTGASGFIGRHTLRLLIERGFEVHAVSNKTSEILISQDCFWHRTNLLDFQQIKDLLNIVKPRYLLHFAWDATPGKYWTSEENFTWIQASIELLKQFREQGGQRVVMSGSCAEYDWNYGYCSEYLTPRNTNSVYGTCKKALQEIFATYCEANQLSGAWGRIFFLYGCYESPNRLVPSVILSLLKEDAALCSHGNQIRDFLYVDDVANAFVSILENDITGCINIGSGNPISVKEIIYTIGEKMGRLDLIRLGALSSSPNEPKLLVADTTRLYNEVGWRPQNDLNTGLDKTIMWWKNNGSIPFW